MLADGIRDDKLRIESPLGNCSGEDEMSNTDLDSNKVAYMQNDVGSPPIKVEDESEVMTGSRHRSHRPDHLLIAEKSSRHIKNSDSSQNNNNNFVSCSSNSRKPAFAGGVRYSMRGA